jgi:hypothetical protein
MGTLEYMQEPTLNPMNESVLQQALDSACQGSGLIFQPMVQGQILYLYINRPSGMAIEYEALSKRIHAIIISLKLSDLRGLWLYSRVLGEIQPEWDRYLEFSTVPTQSFDTLPTVTTASTSITSVMQKGEKVDLSNRVSEGTEPAILLKQYCFTRNRALLTTEVLPPSAEVLQLITDFHKLLEPDKKVILPCLEDFFRSSPVSGMDQCSDDAKTWFETLAQMPAHDLRKAAIWLSRYCYDPKLTLTALQAMLNQEV